MNRTLPKTKDLPVFIVLSALVWAYLWLRAVKVPMAHDEIATFFYYIQTGDFLPFAGHWDMNNHYLNSALGTLFYKIFGLSPLSLRLGNLLFFPLFAVFLWRTGMLMPGGAPKWFFLISLLLSHGFMEFFALSRGYGMSMAMLMAALYYTVSLTGRFFAIKMFKALGWAVLATFSNLSLINTYLILAGWILLVAWSGGRFPGLRKKISLSLWFLVCALPPAIFFTVISFIAKDKGLLYTGGSAGIFSITVKSLTEALTQAGIRATYDLLTLLTLFIAGYGIYKVLRRKTLLQPQLVFAFFLFANILSYWLLNLLFKVNYPENRVALYLFPLFTGALCFAAGDLAEQLNRKAILLFMAPLLFFPLNSAARFNLSYAEFYREDPIPVKFYREVKESHRPGDYPPVMGGPRLRHFCWSFLCYRNGGTESPLLWSDYPGNLAEFQIVDGPNLALFRDGYTPVDRYPGADRYLLRRNAPLVREFLTQTNPFSVTDTSGSEFLNLFSGSADTLAGKSLYVGFEGEISSPASPFQAWIVADVKDAKGNSLRYEFLALNWLRPKWEGASGQIKNGLAIPSLPAESRTLMLYLWNIKKAPLRVEHFTVQVFRFK